MNKRVMLLEDNRENLELLEEFLTGEGYHVIAFDHYESVDAIVDFAPQLILLDIRLSDGYGHLLCEDLKNDPRSKDTPVILVSGANNLEKIARDSHADNYLSKPYDLTDLAQMVKQYT